MVRNTSAPSSTPGTPSAKNAARHPYAWATAPAVSAPRYAPIGPRAANMLSAIRRRAGGKESEKIEIEGGGAPASPPPTPKRASTNCKEDKAKPQDTVNPDQRIREVATMLRRLERSASQAMGRPQPT